MLEKLLKIVSEVLNERKKEETIFNSKLVNAIEELEELEIEYADALESAERYSDLEDPKDWRTARVNKFKRLIEAKQRTIEALKQQD